MPTFNSYVDDDGYYINARPPDVGNVTYQVDPPAASFIRSLGYEDGYKLPWGLISPLRATGLVGTDGMGTSEQLEDVPELDPTKLPELSGTEASKLLSYLEERGDVPDHVLDQVRPQISENESAAESNSERGLGDIIRSKMESEEVISAAVHRELRVDSPVDVDVTLSLGKSIQERHGDKPTRITITIDQSGSPLTEQEIKHDIGMFGDAAIDEWSIQHPYEDTWAGVAKAYETKADVMRALDRASEKLPFEIVWRETEEGGIML